jgi:hypothetical protein
VAEIVGGVTERRPEAIPFNGDCAEALGLLGGVLKPILVVLQVPLRRDPRLGDRLLGGESAFLEAVLRCLLLLLELALHDPGQAGLPSGHVRGDEGDHDTRHAGDHGR